MTPLVVNKDYSGFIQASERGIQRAIGRGGSDLWAAIKVIMEHEHAQKSISPKGWLETK